MGATDFLPYSKDINEDFIIAQIGTGCSKQERFPAPRGKKAFAITPTHISELSAIYYLVCVYGYGQMIDKKDLCMSKKDLCAEKKIIVMPQPASTILQGIYIQLYLGLGFI